MVNPFITHNWLSELNFLTHNGLHEDYVVNLSLIPPDFFCICNVFEGRGSSEDNFTSRPTEED